MVPLPVRHRNPNRAIGDDPPHGLGSGRMMPGPNEAATDGTASPRAAWAAAAALTMAAWCVFAMPWLVDGRVIPWDAKDYYYPVLRALAAARHAGEAGFWNPYLYSGVSAASDPQSWLFTPGFRLLAELVARPTMGQMDLVQLLHLLAGGLGVVALGRRLGWRAMAAALAALVFLAGGVAAARLQHSIMTVSYSWLPWAILLLQLAFTARGRARRWTAALGFGLAAGTMAVGRDQVAFLNCLFLIGCCAWWLVTAARSGGWPLLSDRVVGLLPALVAGVAVLALPMLLTLDALTRSTRPEIAFATAGYASLHPASLLTLVAPDAFGALTPSGYWGSGTLPWMGLSALGFDWNDQTTSHLYIGLVPLALLLVTAFDAPRRLVRDGPVFLAGLLFALAYGLGAYTPLFRAIYEVVPGVDLYRRPNDAAFLLNAMLALLVGAAASGLRRPRRVAGALAWLLPALLVAVAGLALAQHLGRVPDMARALATTLPLLAVATVLVARLGPARFGLPLLLLVSTADLARHGAGPTLNAIPAEAVSAYRPEGERLAAAIRARTGDGPVPPRVEIFGLDRVPGGDGGGSWQNAAMVYGIEQTLGYDPLRSAVYAATTGAQQNSHRPERRLTALFTGYDSAVARQLGIGLVVTGRPIETILPPAAVASLTLVETLEGAWIYANARPLPRALAVGRAEPDVGGPLPGDPAATVLIEGLAAATGSAGPAGEAEITLRRREEVRVRVRMARDGHLVLGDRFHPFWMATVDGRPAPVLRANRIFRAVAIPAGPHEVVFRFDPFRADALADAFERVQDDDD